jgi:polyhydroxyalkanoate synthesis repressor PhaR
MPVIKRYPNRKLYNTQTKRYVTLEGIADLIRRGEEVQVVDHVTEEDLTRVTLTQIILEQEKKQGGVLPKSVLAGLIRAGSDTLTNLRQALPHPRELLGQVDDEIEHRLQVLIKRGELAEEEARRLHDKLIKQGRRLLEATIVGDDLIERALAERNVSTVTDIQKVLDQLDVLAAKLESLSGERGSDPG